MLTERERLDHVHILLLLQHDQLNTLSVLYYDGMQQCTTSCLFVFTTPCMHVYLMLWCWRSSLDVSKNAAVALASIHLCYLVLMLEQFGFGGGDVIHSSLVWFGPLEDALSLWIAGSETRERRRKRKTCAFGFTGNINRFLSFQLHVIYTYV